MSLYKYVPLERIDILLKQKIRYSQPGSFNDPFEMAAFLEKVMETATFDKHMWEEMLKLAEQVNKDATEAGTAKIPREEFFAILEHVVRPGLRPVWEKIIAHVTPKVREGLQHADHLMGILSLTETPSNLLMWSHYADQHRGMVIEFDEAHMTFNERRMPGDDLRYLRKVIYSDARPIVTLENFGFEQFVLTKSTEWAYEKEWRITKTTGDASETIPDSPYDICLFELPASAIKRVILGARVTGAEINTIRETLSLPHLAHIQLQKAALDTRRFALVFEAC